MYTFTYNEYIPGTAYGIRPRYSCRGENLLLLGPGRPPRPPPGPPCSVLSHPLLSSPPPPDIYLTFNPGTIKTTLVPQSSFPPHTQLWTLRPVAGAPGQYTVRAPYQSCGSPTFLAYSRNCNKNEPFLVKKPSPTDSVRWGRPGSAFNPSSLLQLEAVDRACGARSKLVRAGAGNSTCKGEQSLTLVPFTADFQGKRVRWDVKPYATYPVVLEGAVVMGANGKPLYSPSLLLTFGKSVAIDGDTILVGQAPGAYVFTKRGMEGWIRRLLPPPPSVPGGVYYNALFNSVAVSGRLAVVHVSEALSEAQGEVLRPSQLLLYDLEDLDIAPLVLPRPGESFSTFTGFQLSEAFLAVNDKENIYFYGRTPENPLEISLIPQTTLAVADSRFLLSGSTLAVSQGRTTVMYDYNASTNAWVQQTTLKTLLGDAALHNDTLVIGRTGRPVKTPDGQTVDEAVARAYVYQRNAAGNWSLVQKIEEGWGGRTSFSGLALDGETLVMGTGTHIGFTRYKDCVYSWKLRPGGGGEWVRVAVIDRRQEVIEPIGAGVKAVSGDIIAFYAAKFVKGENPPGQGLVQLWSKRREVAADAGGT